jgi:hypothetical protein
MRSNHALAALFPTNRWSARWSPIRRSNTARSRASPQIGARDCGCLILDRKGDLIFGLGRSVWRALTRVFEHEVDLGWRKPGELHVEVDVDEGLQLNRQKLMVPAGIEGQLVIRKHIGAPLGRVQMRQAGRSP